MFEKEIERISQEFNKIVGDFKVSTQKAIIKLKNCATAEVVSSAGILVTVLTILAFLIDIWKGERE